ncbi:hypothetical protein L345_05692, partial [Ophiophagus hannah]
MEVNSRPYGEFPRPSCTKIDSQKEILPLHDFSKNEMQSPIIPLWDPKGSESSATGMYSFQICTSVQ